jgi:isoleucyl-tRNA synthetase
LTEEIYQNLVRAVDPAAPESVHLTRYPQVHNTLVDEALELNIEVVIRIKNFALSLRTKSKSKIRQPLSALYIRPKDAVERRVLQKSEYVEQILEETNVKNLVLIDDEAQLVKVRLKPDSKKLGARAGKYLKAIAEALDQADPKTLLSQPAISLVVSVQKDLGGQEDVDGQKFDLSPDEILVSYEGPPNLQCSLEQGTFLALDTALTPELLQEGLARDFNRLLQDQRKALNLNVSDRILIRYSASPRIAKAIAAHESYLRNELLAESLELNGDQNGAAKLSLGGEEILVTITPARK